MVSLVLISLQLDGRTPLMIACLKQSTDFAIKLVENGADVLALDMVSKYSVLFALYLSVCVLSIVKWLPKLNQL